MTPNPQRAAAAVPSPRAIAFYLPQFHPIPENDAWWGAGFTEWRNVAAARPLFRGHRQPHLPADLGFYDLRVAETRAAQAALARAYGVHGFCYYHYWFGGRRVLERPFAEVLASGEPDFPFCLCWANENWTRAWDGQERDVLLAQQYSSADDLAHIRHLAPALADPRYIRLGGRPLLLVYSVHQLPDPRRTADVWRAEAARLGVGDLCLARVDRFGPAAAVAADPRTQGFDVSVEFNPDGRVFGGRKPPLVRRALNRLARSGLPVARPPENAYLPYDELVAGALARPRPGHRWLRCVAPEWDNSPRRRTGATILTGATPEAYARWLTAVARDELARHPADPIVFVNAWNEWAEGCHLEPDLAAGHAHLRATRDALRAAAVAAPTGGDA